jgi:hypothetical protein
MSVQCQGTKLELYIFYENAWMQKAATTRTPLKKDSKKILWCQNCGKWCHMAAADDMNVDLAAILLELGFSKIQKWGMQN